MKPHLLLGLLVLSAACDRIPYRIVRADPPTKTRTASDFRPAPDTLQPELISIDSIPGITVEALRDPAPTVDSAAMAAPAMVPVPTEVPTYQAPVASRNDLSAWQLGARYRIPRSVTDWLVEPGEIAEFTVHEYGASPEGIPYARIEFTAVSQGRGIRVWGVQRYQWIQTGEEPVLSAIDFTPERIERVGRW